MTLLNIVALSSQHLNLRPTTVLDRQIVDSVVDFAIIATDLSGRIIRWNEGARRVFGWDAEEMLGESAARFFTPEDVAINRPKTEMEQALLLGRGKDERWHLRKNGERFWASGEIMLLKDDSGQTIGFIKVLSDRTELKLAVTDILQQNAHLESEVAAKTLERDRLWNITKDLIVTIGFDGRFRSVNPAWATELGYAEDELLGISFDELIHPDERADAQRAYMETLGGGNPMQEFDWRIRAKDGAYRWYSFNAAVEADVIYVTGREVTARRELEQQRHEAQEADAQRRIADVVRKQLEAERDRLQQLFKQAPSFMAVLRGPQHIFELANLAFHRLIGEREVIGKPVREAIPEVEGQGFFELLDDVYASGKRYLAREARMLLRRSMDAPAIEVYVDFMYQPLLAEDGTVAGIFVDGYEVSERKRANDALRDLNETLEQRVADRTAERDRIWRNSPDLLAVYDPDGTLLSVNPAFETLLGYAERDLLGRSFKAFVHPDDLAVTEEMVKYSATHLHSQMINRWRGKDGGYRTISWVAINDEGTLYATGRDVTEERKQAEALRLAEESLRQAQKMEAVGQLTGGIAHDFNNMLASITGNLELLRIRMAQGQTENISRYIEGAMAGANRAAALTHRLLAFSRRQTLDPKPTDVNELIVSIADLISRTMGPDIYLETALGARLWTALCDPNQLENALLNLAINSRDAMSGGGRLTIETANTVLDRQYAASYPDVAPGKYVRICVTDTGSGMDAETLSRALDPFFTTKPVGQGTGLGLSMIYGFVKQSKGHLRIYSQLGGGTTVQLFLPRHAGAAETDAAGEQPADVPRADGSAAVLLVEDEEAVRRLGAEMLRGLGYTVVEAADAREGLERLHSMQRVDLLITDVGLPNGMDGRQFADAGRKMRPDLKVLFITGFAENAAVGNGMLDPGMHVMTKPFSMAAFAGKVRSMIEMG